MSPFVEKFKKTLTMLGGGIAALFLFSFGIESSKTMPPQALLFLEKDGTYFSPPCLYGKPMSLLRVEPGKDLKEEHVDMSQLEIIKMHKDGKIFFIETEKTILRPLTRAEVDAKPGSHPDPKCRDQNGFMQDDRSLGGKILERIGLLSALPSRWTEEGAWLF